MSVFCPQLLGYYEGDNWQYNADFEFYTSDDNDKGGVVLPNPKNFWKNAKGGGVIFNPKIYMADFGNSKEGVLIMKMIQNSNFRVPGLHVFSTIVLRKSKQDTL